MTCAPNATFSYDCAVSCSVADTVDPPQLPNNVVTCNVHVLTRFTGSFGASTDVNFSSLWLRPDYFLLVDTWLTDVLFGGLNFVNAGDPSGVMIGYFGTCARCVFHGDTQNTNAGNGALAPGASEYAMPRGPVRANATTVLCDRTVGYINGACVIPSDGRVYNYADFAQSSMCTWKLRGGKAGFLIFF